MGHRVRACAADKTIDLDRPEDLREAEAFLRRGPGKDVREA